MFSGDRRRRMGLHSFFTTQIRRHFLPYGNVSTSDDLAGVSVWGPPSRPRPGMKELLELLPTAPFLVGTRTFRALQLLAEIDSLHPREPHWYLATLGTEPDRQGEGIGSALLTATLTLIDDEGMPAYLESSKERNVPFYRRFGFVVVDEFRSKGGGPPMWRMWREPQVPKR